MASPPTQDLTETTTSRELVQMPLGDLPQRFPDELANFVPGTARAIGEHGEGVGAGEVALHRERIEEGVDDAEVRDDELDLTKSQLCVGILASRRLPAHFPTVSLGRLLRGSSLH